MSRRWVSIAFVFGVGLAACGGGGGGGSASLPAPGPTTTSSSPSPGTTSTPTPTISPSTNPSSSPTINPTSSPAAEQITGRIVDANTGLGIGGLTVAAAPEAGATLQTALSGSSAPVGNANVVTTTTASDGTFTITCGSAFTVSGTDFCASATFGAFVSAYGGSSYGMNSFHGTFGSGFNYGTGGSGTNIGTVKLTNLATHYAEEVTELNHLNAFRAAPGPGSEYGYSSTTTTYPQYGVSTALVFDENLVEVAHYWAAEMHTAGTWGHTCAAINNPSGCVDPLTYGGTLAGVRTAAFGDAQNVSSGYVSWTDNTASSGTATSSAESGFEIEGGNAYGSGECSNAYNVATCAAGDPPTGAGHFKNIMQASKWAGFGEVETSVNTFDMEFI